MIMSDVVGDAAYDRYKRPYHKQRTGNIYSKLGSVPPGLGLLLGKD